MHYKKLKLAVFVWIVCLGFSSCGKDENPVETTKYVLTVTPASTDVLNFAGADLNVTVEVKEEKNGAAADVSWDVSSPETWISYDPQRGTGSGTFKITATANPNETERVTKVTVSIRNSDVKQELTVRQGPKEINFEIFRKGKFSDFCVGGNSQWGKDWGEYSAVIYHKCELGADGELTLSTDYRLHYHILEFEPGYIEFVSVESKQYASAWTVPITEGKSSLQDCGLKDTSPKYIGEYRNEGNGNGELWDHCRQSQKVTYKFHLKAGTYWLVALRAGTCEDPAYPDMSQYPVDVPVDEIIKFVKD
jgi:hypothetical protein